MIDRADIGPHGFIELVKVYGTEEDIEAAARTSYEGQRSRSDTRGLLRYLMRNKHTSPFEMAEMVFRIKAPVFVARQWVRHRTANMNEMSGRYCELPDEFWLPDEWRGQATVNKQGSEGLVDYVAGEFLGNGGQLAGFAPLPLVQVSAEGAAMQEYRRRLEAGVSREVARSCLPLSIYTVWVWKIDLHNLLHFLQLRCDSHAQKEIRDYADVMLRWVSEHFPLVHEAFMDYRVNAVTFSAREFDLLRLWIQQGARAEYIGMDGLAQSETLDFTAKIVRLTEECGS